MLQEPIKLTLYDENDEEKRTLECKRIPWGMLKKALALESVTKGQTDDKSMLNAVSGFVCDLYRNQVTVEELDTGADMLDMITVIKSVLSYAGALNPNA